MINKIRHTIRGKILATNAAILIILLAVLVYSLVLLHHNNNLITEQKKVNSDIDLLVTIEAEFLRLRVSSTEFMALLQEDVKQQRDNLFEVLGKSFKALEGNPQGIELLFSEYRQHIEGATEAFLNDDRMSGSILLQQSSTKADNIQQAILGLLEQKKRNLEQLVEKVNKSNQQVSLSLYFLLFTTVVVGTSLSIFLANRISCNIKKFEQIVSRIEEEGDLRLRTDIKSQDEIGQLARSFNKLVDSQAEIVSTVMRQANDLKDFAIKLDVNAKQTNHDVEEQNGQTNQIAQAIEQMSTAVNHVAASTSTASLSAKECSEQATQGEKIVQEAIITINALVENVHESGQLIEGLRTKSEGIDTILEVIRDITDQTNLLALNAAIEAARAGEQGRGFAVVADEVRSLAQRTQSSTSEIEELVVSLQKASLEAENMMQQGIHATHQSVEQSNHAGQSLQAITQGVANILELNIQIAESTDKQSNTAEEINKRVRQIQKMSQTTMAGINATAKSSNTLLKTSEELREVVGQFKV